MAPLTASTNTTRPTRAMTYLANSPSRRNQILSLTPPIQALVWACLARIAGGVRRRWCRRCRARDAAALAHAALTRSTAQSLLKQIADSRSKLAAERIGRLAALSVGGTLSAPEQTAERAEIVEPRAVGAEQALAHLLELCVGGIGIVEDALHVRIDARLGPWPFDHDGNAEPDRIGGAALAFRGHHEFRLNPESYLFGVEIDGADAGHLHQRTDQIEVGSLRLPL